VTSSQYSPQLSKSRFMAGLQCLKRLYLECYERELADPIDERQQAIFDTGTGVGELAREMYPNGRLVEEQYFELAKAIKTTETVLADVTVGAIFEGAFFREDPDKGRYPYAEWRRNIRPYRSEIHHKCEVPAYSRRCDTASCPGRSWNLHPSSVFDAH